MTSQKAPGLIHISLVWEADADMHRVLRLINLNFPFILFEFNYSKYAQLLGCLLTIKGRPWGAHSRDFATWGSLVCGFARKKGPPTFNADIPFPHQRTYLSWSVCVSQF